MSAGAERPPPGPAAPRAGPGLARPGRGFGKDGSAAAPQGLGSSDEATGAGGVFGFCFWRGWKEVKAICLCLPKGMGPLGRCGKPQ